MNNEEIGKRIKEIRKQHNLSQKEFAEKFGITYQAVSKWENGKNIPDISILKQICNEYDLSLDEIFNNSANNKSKRKIIIGVIISLLIILISIILILILKKDTFTFKTISSNCEDFKVTGSIAYNKEKTSIYISNINYCGEEDLLEYERIDCSFYEENNKEKIIIEKCDGEDNTTLEKFLKNLSFQIDNYVTSCKKYTEDSLFLQIEATYNNKITQYKIPLKLDDNCK